MSGHCHTAEGLLACTGQPTEMLVTFVAVVGAILIHRAVVRGMRL